MKNVAQSNAAKASAASIKTADGSAFNTFIVILDAFSRTRTRSR
jgi:hypothetical protein